MPVVDNCAERPLRMYYILRKCQEGAKNLAFPACLVMIQEEVCMGSRVHVESRTGKAQ